MQFYIKSAIFFCCVLGYPIPLTPLTKLVENIEYYPDGPKATTGNCERSGESAANNWWGPEAEATEMCNQDPECIGLHDAFCDGKNWRTCKTITFAENGNDCTKQKPATVTGLVDECADGTHNCDPLKARCTDTSGGFSCSCNHGYQGAGTVGTCADVNECDNGRGTEKGHNCDNHAICTNTAYDPATKKGFTCTCDELYHGNGMSCSDQDLYTVGDSCGSAGCTCPTDYVPTRQDVSVESQLDCQTAAAFLGITAENSCDPEEEDITAENYCHYDEIAYSNNSTRPKGCYHSCNNNRLYIAKNPSARTNYRTKSKNPVLANPSEDCDSYIRLHLCQSIYL